MLASTVHGAAFYPRRSPHVQPGHARRVARRARCAPPMDRAADPHRSRSRVLLLVVACGIVAVFALGRFRSVPPQAPAVPDAPTRDREVRDEGRGDGARVAVDVAKPDVAERAAAPAREELADASRTRPAGPTRSFHVAVRALRGDPLPGAVCTLHVGDDAHDAVVRGTSDDAGDARIAFDAAWRVRGVEVSRPGWTTFRASLGPDDPPTMTAVLARAGTVRVIVRDDAGRLREGHAITVSFVDGTGDGQVWADRVGFVEPIRARTGAGGVAVVDGLPPGRFEISGAMWRDCLPSGHRVVEVRADDVTDVETTVVGMPLRDYASGVVEPAPAPADVADGVALRWRIEVEDRSAPSPLLVHADGGYVLPGDPGAEHRVRLVEVDANDAVTRRSAWWSVRIGAHGVRTRPQFE